jgi:thymidylate kinase
MTRNPFRRRGPVLAILGPDGAGKGSVIAALERQLPMPVTAVYLGLGASGAIYRPARARPGSPLRGWATVALGAIRGALRRAAAALPDVVRVSQSRLRQTLTLAARLLPAYVQAWRGDLILCDRHPLEHLALAPPLPRAVAAFERLFLGRLLPWPDAVVILDAPPAVLFARKPEHPVELLEEWRRRYREALLPRGARVVSTDRPLDETVTEVAAIAWEAVCARGPRYGDSDSYACQ